MRLCASLLALLLNAAPVLAQQTAGSVSGKVVNSVTGQAVKKAVVYLRSPTGQNSLTTTADQSGKFHFDNVQPDRYTASAQAPGYSENTQNMGKRVVVAAQQEVDDIEVPIPPLASISGKVVDEDGQPLADVNVNAIRYAYFGPGGKRIQVASSAQTDDRGEYRIFDLQPERYYLAAVSYQRAGLPGMAQNQNLHSTVPEEGYAPVFYPGVADISQAPLQEVKPGMEWTGADFKLRKAAAYHIRGVVAGAVDRQGRNMVRAQWCGQDEVEMPFSTGAGTQLDSRFDIAGAVPGTYCVTVTQPGTGGIAARKLVTVKASDINDVEFTVPTAFNVAGTVTVEGTPPNPMPQINIGLINADMRGNRQARMNSDGTFQIEGLYPGAYTFLLPQGPGYVKSILYGTQDVSNGVIPNLQPGVPLNITLGADPGEIDGTVQPGSVESGAPVLVAIIPEDAYAARMDMQRQVPTSAGGNFAMGSLPPGNYKIFALETGDFSDLQNRELLKLLESGATVAAVTAGGNQRVSVTAISASQVQQARGKLK